MGPLDAAKFGDALKSSPTLNADGPQRFAGKGEWWPNAMGMPDFGSMLVSGTQVQQGALVVTDSAVLFARWVAEPGLFVVIKRMPVSDLLNAYSEKNFLVVQRDDSSFDSFRFVRADMALVDSAMAEAAAKHLKAAIPAR